MAGRTWCQASSKSFHEMAVKTDKSGRCGIGIHQSIGAGASGTRFFAGQTEHAVDHYAFPALVGAVKIRPISSINPAFLEISMPLQDLLDTHGPHDQDRAISCALTSRDTLTGERDGAAGAAALWSVRADLSPGNGRAAFERTIPLRQPR
jgi:hypothetical protein